jgi:hypothetical protein
MNVQEILNTWDEGKDMYAEATRIEGELFAIGYACDWGLSGEIEEVVPFTDALYISAETLENMGKNIIGTDDELEFENATDETVEVFLNLGLTVSREVIREETYPITVSCGESRYNND